MGSSQKVAKIKREEGRHQDGEGVGETLKRGSPYPKKVPPHGERQREGGKRALLVRKEIKSSK